MHKSARTQRHYQKAFRGQRKLTGFGFMDPQYGPHLQLLVQVKSAIEIFEAAQPNCQALFVFDQSTAHASLPPDALKAFTMNKSNGGAQCKQKNTVIPQSNPDLNSMESIRNGHTRR
jgi:hypothetical protein